MYKERPFGPRVDPSANNMVCYHRPASLDVEKWLGILGPLIRSPGFGAHERFFAALEFYI